MSRWIKPAATIAAAAFAIAAAIVFVADYVVLSGTLLLFTAFSIYVREMYGRVD